MKVLRGGQGVSGAAGGLRQRRARARRGGYKKTRRAAPDGDDGVKRHKGVKLEAEGLVREELHEGQLDAPPGLGLVRHGGVGAALVLFWLLVSCLRGAASRGPARGGAARRGGGGGVGGGALPRARVLRGVLFCFGAKLCNVGCENGGNAQRPHSFGPARAEARRRARARDACRPRDSAEPSQTRPRGHPRSRGDRAGAGPSARRSVRRPAVAGRAPGSVATMSVSPPRSLKKRSRANPSAPTSKRKHANRRPTPCVSNTAAPRPQPREKPAAPNTTDKPERRRAPPQLPNKSPRRL